MAFNKRRKQPHLFRGGNPHPTAEEIATGAGTHVGNVAHSWPHPTAEQIALGLGAPADTPNAQNGAPRSRKPKGAKLGRAKSRVKH